MADLLQRTWFPETLSSNLYNVILPYYNITAKHKKSNARKCKNFLDVCILYISKLIEGSSLLARWEINHDLTNDTLDLFNTKGFILGYYVSYTYTRTFYGLISLVHPLFMNSKFTLKHTVSYKNHSMKLRCLAFYFPLRVNKQW